MSWSRRTLIDRTPRPIIDAESVLMFKRGVKLMSEGREDEKEFRNLDLDLHRRLNLRPWHESILYVDDNPPKIPGQLKNWKLVTALRQQLLAAAFGEDDGGGQESLERLSARQVVRERLPEMPPTYHHGASKPWIGKLP